MSIATLERHIADGTLIRRAWTGVDARGRKTACLLSALSPEVAAAEDASACPAELMPEWLAGVTPWINDSGSRQHWNTVVRRYAALAHRWSVLTDEDWRWLDYRCRAVAVREATRHTTNTDAVAACDAVLLLLDRAGSGGAVTPDKWAAAYGAARAAARATAAEGAARAAAIAAARAAGGAARAADRIIDGILDAIEWAIDGRGG